MKILRLGAVTVVQHIKSQNCPQATFPVLASELDKSPSSKEKNSLLVFFALYAVNVIGKN